MSINFTVLAILAIFFGVLIFLTDFYEKQHPKLNISLIAGISISYFFLVILPEITKRVPQFPSNLEFIEYSFILIGFVFVHVSEKLIRQKVEFKSQRRMRKLVEKEKILQDVEDSIENILEQELVHEKLDNITLKDIARTLNEMKRQEKVFKTKINRYKIKIQNHISEELRNLRFFTHFVYHFLVGIIIVGLLAIDLISGILFFLFAWFRAIITYRTEGHIIFTDLEIYETPELLENKKRKWFLASSCLLGIILGFTLDLFGFEYTETFYILYSFISGVILYTIVREILPEKEKGKPLYFSLGFIGFTLILLAINIIRSLF